MTGSTKTAEALLANRQAGRAVPLADWAATGLTPPDAEAAYLAQHAMTALREAQGHRPIGYKIGATNQMARDLLQVPEPFYGRLYAETSEWTSAAELALVPGYHQVAEPEIAVVLGRDLDPAGGPFDASAIAAATRGLMPVIEIIGCCFEPWMQAGGPTLIADNGAHGSWIAGAEVNDWQGFDPLEASVSVTRTEGDDMLGRGAAVDGGAFGAVAWLANKLASQGQGLKAGDVISTGTVTPPIPLVAGDVIAVDCGPLGRVSVSVAA